MYINILDNYNYGLIILHKYKTIRTLENIVQRTEQIEIPVLNIISLYLIDTNNCDEKLESKDKIEYVNKLISLYEKDSKYKLCLKSNEIKDILNNCAKYKVDNKTNRKIALLVAKYNNNLYKDNKTSLVRIDKLIHTLDQLDRIDNIDKIEENK